MTPEYQSSARPILGLEAARRFRRISWSWLAILDILAIAGFVGFIHADLIFAPGQPIELPQSTQTTSRRVEAVLSVHGDLYLFDGQVFKVDNIVAGFRDYFERNPQSRDRATLLIKMDSKSPVSALLQLCEQAQDLGFVAVHVAEIPSKETVGDSSAF